MDSSFFLGTLGILVFRRGENLKCRLTGRNHVRECRQENCEILVKSKTTSRE
jgi:hypothetical protein